ncbi:MAG: MBL fold metallo-hydrolase [Candidatus Paceibacterota bacterium]
MKIKKLGHCCLVIDINRERIMTDPGGYTTSQNEEKNITAVLITHEHGDHLHIGSLKKVLENNPGAVVITNASVGKILSEEGIKYTIVEEKQSFEIGSIKIKGFGNLHAEIYGTYGQVQNTGYMIDGLCYPGDSFNHPDCEVDILALPIAGPWLKIKDAIDYAKAVRPRIVFPVHDIIIQDFATFLWEITDHFITEAGFKFKKLEIGKEEDM